MIVADIEASSLDYRKGSILSIGAVDFNEPHRLFYAECRARNDAELSPDALAVCGFTAEQCRDSAKPELQEVMRRFYEWLQPIGDRTLAGQNVSFDRDYLNDGFGRAGISWHFSYRTVDLHSVAYADHIHRGIPVPQSHNRSALNLEAIARYVGIPEEPRPHNALNGAKTEAEAFSRILFGRSLLPEYNQYPLPRHLARISTH